MSNDFWLKRNSIWIALYRCGFDIRIEYKIPEISTRIEDYRTQLIRTPRRTKWFLNNRVFNVNHVVENKICASFGSKHA